MAGLAAGISVVVPVYNSEGTLPHLVERLLGVLGRLAGQHEVILVNDGSRDDSWSVVADLAARDGRVRGIDLMRNYGQHNALLRGIRAARYDVVVTMDDDLQHPPEEIPRMTAALADGCDVVYGTPLRPQHGARRDAASWVVKLGLRTVMGAETARNVSAFRAFRTQLREAFAHYDSAYVSIDVLLTWATTRFGAVAVRHEPRRVGRSNYNVWKLVGHAVNLVTGFSALPLRIATMLGFGLTIVGIGILVVVLARYALEGSVPGFPFLASTIAIFSGAQLFSLGIIGEYLGRMHFRSMGRPYSVVRRRTGAVDQARADEPPT